MFDVGDAVYHPANGAGVIASLQRLPMLRKGQRFYRIRMVDGTNTVVMIPVKKADDIGLRPAISSRDAERVLQVLSEDPEELPDDHKRRYQVCGQKLAQADTIQTAEVVRDLTWRQIQKDHLNAPGQRILKQALRLLTSELAVAQGIALSEAQDQVNTVLRHQQPA